VVVAFARDALAAEGNAAAYLSHLAKLGELALEFR
jgi:hypothetical protein